MNFFNQKSYKIINTEIADLGFIYWLFDEAIIYQQRNNYPVWKAYDKEILKKEIVNKQQYKILTNKEIACIFSICWTDKMVWRERDDGSAIYLHRIVVNPNHKGQKQFGKILDFTIKLAKELQFSRIRMDTWADNPSILSYYQSFNFKIIDYYTTPNSTELPVQQRNNWIVLLEYSII